MVLENLKPVLNLSVVLVNLAPAFEKTQVRKVRAGHERSGGQCKSRPQQQAGQNSGLFCGVHEPGDRWPTGSEEPRSDRNRICEFLAHATVYNQIKFRQTKAGTVFKLQTVPASSLPTLTQIGRAACRERGEISVVAGRF